MIRLLGAAFTTAADGDQLDDVHRAAVSARLGISADWALAMQVHGASAAIATSPGPAGAVDGLVTTEPDLPIAVRTADCAGVVLHGHGSVGVAHAGWRGAAAGIVPAVVEEMAVLGAPPLRGVIGPHIGPCC
ncbi:MAG: polyphenol oxidase family protein, partial [Acidimicrobiia bacterium]|nr:polyphenol oxidase family protein [Acidimicrobiia bacterium]